MKKIILFLCAMIISLVLVSCNELPIEGGEPNIPEGGNEEEDKKDVTISEKIIVDEKGIKITAKSLNLSGIFGPELKVLIENNSGIDLTFQCSDSSVNGYMVDTIMSVNVVNGKKVNDSVVFSASSFEKCEIEIIADMEFSFHIFNTNDWDTYLDTKLIQIKTSAADSYDYIFNDSGSVAYNDNGIKIVARKLLLNESFFGPTLEVYLENNTNKNIIIQARNVSVNGFMISEIFSCEILEGKKAIDDIIFMSSDLEENEITDIQYVELSFHIYDSESWDTIIDTKIVKIDFK